jgi:cytochrome P450 family 9
LRLWPPGFQTDRLCVKDYVIEPINPKEKVVFVEKGTTVVIPVMALHRDPQYFSEPNKFDPERFSDENKSKIVPGSYLPFGLGPRNCIGSRFALLEIKILFFHLMSKFIILPDDETQFPVTISPKKINMAPETGFRLGLKPRIPAVVRLARTLEDLKASSATTDSHESVTLSAHDGTAQN